MRHFIQWANDPQVSVMLLCDQSLITQQSIATKLLINHLRTVESHTLNDPLFYKFCNLTSSMHGGIKRLTHHQQYYVAWFLKHSGDELHKRRIGVHKTRLQAVRAEILTRYSTRSFMSNPALRYLPKDECFHINATNTYGLDLNKKDIIEFDNGDKAEKANAAMLYLYLFYKDKGELGHPRKFSKVYPTFYAPLFKKGLLTHVEQL